MADLRAAICNHTGFYKHIDTLTNSQMSFIDLLNNWFQNPRNMVVLVSGGPGSGKTYTVIETLNFITIKSLRMAPSAFLAANIGGQTIHSHMHLNWKPGSNLHKIQSKLEEETNIDTCLETSKILKDEMFYKGGFENIVILDEIGMVPFWLTYWLIRYFFDKKRKVLFIGMGDSRQLKPVKSQYNIFNVDFNKEFEIYPIEFQESKRFSPQYESIIQHLSRLMDENNLAQLLKYVLEHYPVVENIDVDISKRCKRALVYRNSTVELYNKFYMSQFQGNSYRLYRIFDKKVDKKTFIDIKSGCKVVVTNNDVSENKSVVNGTVLTFDEYDKINDCAVCLDGKNKKVLVGRIEGMIPIIPHFAGTIHKFQGQTIDLDNIVFNFNGCTDMHLIYTALSRVRSMNQILAVAL